MDDIPSRGLSPADQHSTIFPLKRPASILRTLLKEPSALFVRKCHSASNDFYKTMFPHMICEPCTTALPAAASEVACQPLLLQED